MILSDSLSDALSSPKAQAVNFRSIRMGNIAPGILYRSSHPIKDNRQEEEISLLAAMTGIAAVINLSDTYPELYTKALFAPWYNNLYQSKKVIALGMGFGTSGQDFNKKLKKGLQFIIDTKGPWLIHCFAGVDRTGFVSMVLEAFMGATIDDIEDDYFYSFNSIFESSVHSELKKKDSLVVIQLLSVMTDSMTINDRNLQTIAEQYLRNTIGLTAEETELLKKKLLTNH